MVRFLRPHDRVVDIHQTVDDIREVLILRYLYHLAADTGRAVHLRDLGNALHVPYDDAIRLAHQLEEDGFLHPLDGEREPGGPGLRLTAAGRRAAEEEEVYTGRAQQRPDAGSSVPSTTALRPSAEGRTRK